MRLKTIGFLGDLHAGSYWAPWPEDLLPSRGCAIPRYLNKCLKHLADKWPALDLLVLMGDLVDGRQPKSQCTGLFTAQLGEQVDGAIELIRPFAKKAKKIIRVHGTSMHEEFQNALGKLDEALGIDAKKGAKQVFDLDLGTGILNIAHHPAGGAAIYMGTTVDRESLWSQIAAHAGHVPDARWIVRAHKHSYLMQEAKKRTMVQCPCFQMPTPYSIKQNYHRFQPDLGGLLMQADSRHDSGFQFYPTLYNTLVPEVSKL